MSQRSIAVSTTRRPYDSTPFRSHARSECTPILVHKGRYVALEDEPQRTANGYRLPRLPAAIRVLPWRPAVVDAVMRRMTMNPMAGFNVTPTQAPSRRVPEAVACGQRAIGVVSSAAFRCHRTCGQPRWMPLRIRPTRSGSSGPFPVPPASSACRQTSPATTCWSWDSLLRIRRPLPPLGDRRTRPGSRCSRSRQGARCRY